MANKPARCTSAPAALGPFSRSEIVSRPVPAGTGHATVRSAHVALNGSSASHSGSLRPAAVTRTSRRAFAAAGARCTRDKTCVRPATGSAVSVCSPVKGLPSNAAVACWSARRFGEKFTTPRPRASMVGGGAGAGSICGTPTGACV